MTTHITHLKGSLTDRSNEAEVRLIEGQADTAEAKAKLWRTVRAIASVGLLLAWMLVVALVITSIAEFVSWF